MLLCERTESTYLVTLTNTTDDVLLRNFKIIEI